MDFEFTETPLYWMETSRDVEQILVGVFEELLRYRLAWGYLEKCICTKRKNYTAVTSFLIKPVFIEYDVYF